MSSVVPANEGNVNDTVSFPGSGRSPGGGHGNPLQYSCLENPTDRGAWWAAVHRVTKSWTQLKWLSLHTQTDLKHLLMKITSLDTLMAYMTCDETCLTGWDSALTWVSNSLWWYLEVIINFLFSLSFLFYKHWLFLLFIWRIKPLTRHSPHPLRANKAHSRGLSYK